MALGERLKPMKEQCILVLCTCPDEQVAGRIAAALVDERLAACVNYLPGIKSTYRWQGCVQTDAETLLLVKSTRSRYDQVERRIAELHPYELPEIVALPFVAGSERYLQWLSQSVAPGSRA
jgi:periplasmic divalent cation tolerance protein